MNANNYAERRENFISNEIQLNYGDMNKLTISTDMLSNENAQKYAYSRIFKNFDAKSI